MNDTLPQILRRSPLFFDLHPLSTRMHQGFKVVTEYEHENRKPGPVLVDLSHMAKWDVQSHDLATHKVLDMDVPTQPGMGLIQQQTALFRMNAIQAGVWSLNRNDPPPMPTDPAYTDITDGFALFALAGDELLDMMELITAIDFGLLSLSLPFFAQGPVLHLSCRVMLAQSKSLKTFALMACPRGYAQSLIQAVLDTCSRIGLHVAGENAFFDL